MPSPGIPAVSRFSSSPLYAFALALALAAGPVQAAGNKLEVVRHERVAGELLVKFRADVNEQGAQAILREHTGGGHEAKRFKAPRKVSHAAIGRWWHVKLPPGQSEKTVLPRLARHPKVEAAEPNYIVKAVATPDDPRYPEQWSLNNIGQTGGTPGADIDAPEAWDRVTGSSGIVVAVIDTGVDYTHPDLAANIWTNPGEIPGNGIDDDGNGYVDDVHGYDFYFNDPDPADDFGHGTHVAGTIAAAGNNGVGVAGICWAAQIMPVKFLGPGGSGYTSDAIRAVLYATDMGARVLNNSWGGGGYSEALRDAVVAAYEANVLFVAAAGNSSSNADVVPLYPAAYDVPNVISVAATDHYDGLAYFSNYGPNSVHLGAPGVNILSTVSATGDPCCSDASGYKLLSGTSMATPHVAGSAALLLAQDASRSAIGLKSLLLDTVSPVPSLAGVTVTGGRLNVNNAASCSPTQLKVSIIQPRKDFVAYLNEPFPVAAAVNTCGTPVPGAQIGASASTGETLTLYDDGAHGDGAANDGVYGGTWRPVAGGAATLTVTATHPALGADTRSIDGRAMERVRYGVAPAQYAWNDIADGTRYFLYDNGQVLVPIGFDFAFFGQTYSNVTIDANGLLGFGNAFAGGGYNNYAIPNRLSPNNFIGAFFDNLDTGTGAVYGKIEGAAPNRKFTVSWVDVKHVWFASGGITFQIVLREGSEDILVQYQDVVFGPEVAYLNNGAHAVVGVENFDGTYGTQYSYFQPSLQDQTALQFVRVPTGNLPPIAKPGGAYQTFVNQPLTFDGSASYDPDGSALTYRWDFGDGTTGTGVGPTHTYTAKGTYTVTLIVHDQYEDSAPTTTTVSVPNRAPIANAGGPYTGGVSPQAILFDGSGSYDPDGDYLANYRYYWDFGDGTTWDIGPTMWHSYYQPGTYTVTLTVGDGFLVSAPSSATVTVINLPPVADAGPDQTVSKNVDPVRLNATNSSDPEGRPWTAAWRQVSGAPVTLVDANTAVPYFSIPKNIKPLPMQLVFEVKITDNWGASATDQVVITVTR